MFRLIFADAASTGSDPSSRIGHSQPLVLQWLVLICLSVVKRLIRWLRLGVCAINSLSGWTGLVSSTNFKMLLLFSGSNVHLGKTAWAAALRLHSQYRLSGLLRDDSSAVKPAVLVASQIATRHQFDSIRLAAAHHLRLRSPPRNQRHLRLALHLPPARSY